MPVSLLKTPVFIASLFSGGALILAYSLSGMAYKTDTLGFLLIYGLLALLYFVVHAWALIYPLLGWKTFGAWSLIPLVVCFGSALFVARVLPPSFAYNVNMRLAQIGVELSPHTFTCENKESFILEFVDIGVRKMTSDAGAAELTLESEPNAVVMVYGNKTEALTFAYGYGEQVIKTKRGQEPRSTLCLPANN